MATTPLAQCIILKGELGDFKYEEATPAAGFSPGHILELIAGGTVQKHSKLGGRPTRMIAVEDGLRAKAVTDAYTTADLGRFKRWEVGDLLQARVPANAVALVAGDPVMSNGDGTLVKASGAGVQLYSNVAASGAVTNTVTPTTFDKSYTIPANTLQVGDVITIEGQGIATATNSTDTLAVAVKVGATTIVTLPALDVANNDIFWFRITLIIRTIGASGTFVADASYSIGTPDTATTKAQFKASTTIDTTATQAITVVATWSVANAGNSCRLDVLTVYRQGDGGHIWGFAEEAKDNSANATEDFFKLRAA